MSDFERWFEDQDFYTNMRFIHGDKLFDKDGGVYRVLPVQMVYQGWNTQRQRSKGEFVALTQEWHTKGWNARQEEVDDLKAEIKKLRNLVGQAGCEIDAYQEWISELKTQLAVYKEDMQRDAEKISELENRIHDAELQIAVHWGADEDTDSVLRDVENALRGDND